MMDKSGRILCEFYMVEKGIKSACFYTGNPKELKKVIKLASCFKLYFIEKDDWIVFSSDKTLMRLFDLFKGHYKLRHKILGIMCGYPDCCIKDYLKYQGDEGFKKKYKKYKKMLSKKKDPYELEIKEDKESICFIKISHHIPCSPFCEETKKIMRIYKYHYKQFLKKLNNYKKMIKILELE